MLPPTMEYSNAFALQNEEWQYSRRSNDSEGKASGGTASLKYFCDARVQVSKIDERARCPVLQAARIGPRRCSPNRSCGRNNKRLSIKKHTHRRHAECQFPFGNFSLKEESSESTCESTCEFINARTHGRTATSTQRSERHQPLSPACALQLPFVPPLPPASSAVFLPPQPRQPHALGACSHAFPPSAGTMLPN